MFPETGSLYIKLDSWQIISNIHVLNLVQEFGTGILKVSEHFLNTNLKFLSISSFLELEDTYAVDTPSLINKLSKMTRNVK